MEVPFATQSNHVITDEMEQQQRLQEDDVESMSSFGSAEEDNEEPNNSIESSEDELREEAISSSSSGSSLCSSSPLSSASLDDQLLEEGPLFEMSSLISILPFKRGLSKHYDGKSQSFTSLSNVSSLENLAKPERPYKKLKSCMSYAAGVDNHKPLYSTLINSSRAISKKVSRASFSSLNSRRS